MFNRREFFTGLRKLVHLLCSQDIGYQTKMLTRARAMIVPDMADDEEFERVAMKAFPIWLHETGDYVEELDRFLRAEFDDFPGLF